jgi:hypothetical protein
LEGANNYFTTDINKRAYLVIEDIIRTIFSIEGGNVDLLYEGCIVDIRNTDNAWIEGAVYLFNLGSSLKNGNLEHYKLIKKIATSNNLQDKSNSYSWFNLNKASNGIPLEWDKINVTCCEGNGLLFIALANGYLLGQDIIEREHRIKMEKIQKENKVISDNIERKVEEISELNTVTKKQTKQLEDDTSNLNSKILELKQIGENAISKEDGLSLIEYRNLLHCDSENGLQNKAICKKSGNTKELVNNNWIDRGFSETSDGDFIDENISSATDISKPIENTDDTSSVSASEGTSINMTDEQIPTNKTGGNHKDDNISYLFTE